RSSSYHATQNRCPTTGLWCLCSFATNSLACLSVHGLTLSVILNALVVSNALVLGQELLGGEGGLGGDVGLALGGRPDPVQEHPAPGLQVVGLVEVVGSYELGVEQLAADARLPGGLPV